MNRKEILKNKLNISAILFNNNVPVDEAKIIGTFIEDLEQQAQEKRENCFNDRLEYAKKQFEENNIPYKLCNESIGRFNLLDSKGKVLMSFWSYTGKLYIISTGFSDNVGIRNCIKKYKKIVGSDSNE